MRTLAFVALFVRCLFPWTLLYLFLLSTALADEGGKVLVEVRSLRNQSGQICVALYRGAEFFLKPGKASAGRCVPASASAIELGGVPPGRYAIGVHHDEDSDGRVRTNFLGIPMEGIGVSRNPKSRFGPPKFDDAAFDLSRERLTFQVDVSYF